MSSLYRDCLLDQDRSGFIVQGLVSQHEADVGLYEFLALTSIPVPRLIAKGRWRWRGRLKIEIKSGEKRRGPPCGESGGIGGYFLSMMGKE
ncbi:hypothetical protein C8J48_3033 [Desmospora activa DSM 45169]|uniref:Uncharacterized protein n=2 Tax=Desmospora TaxID=500614 RepID=A0A2T4Z482_9BACL|nr:hypothetical protein C8J48_3033 [Desmospora activa DSM 45169]